MGQISGVELSSTYSGFYPLLKETRSAADFLRSSEKHPCVRLASSRFPLSSSAWRSITEISVLPAWFAGGDGADGGGGNGFVTLPVFWTVLLSTDLGLASLHCPCKILALNLIEIVSSQHLRIDCTMYVYILLGANVGLTVTLSMFYKRHLNRLVEGTH